MSVRRAASWGVLGTCLIRRLIKPYMCVSHIHPLRSQRPHTSPPSHDAYPSVESSALRAPAVLPVRPRSWAPVVSLHPLPARPRTLPAPLEPPIPNEPAVAEPVQNVPAYRSRPRPRQPRLRRSPTRSPQKVRDAGRGTDPIWILGRLHGYRARARTRNAPSQPRTTDLITHSATTLTRVYDTA